ncbi:MAG: UMP kinase [Candidatus Sungbacteria bacterium RIFCSPLOWO2_01_FULL_47_32]|uniref:Uridylate kinase n=1 Tax=Candidatus Sungbacteria bacterium RIFCSPHIGHO2_01_FULL_47_32 TaxID=1802264 RepID=A0A1G2K819_9BACT|nr:MAG: UMP kinase [Parcubacteria group bacterium GW2011_GWA2_47_10]OGZ95572.1 MAG: UMP kinase [Candidatus Sungbacteria bacterium RIFCSPHIGHO2_01_FULL_47_32]OGZ99287.1 MAG: UMP kinase [Candidatus Sungbacteria bacterium RIFCSPHIGHO2_02_FULL_46_12]OHA06332.1 MAG: UMP kinase [Candidatus Sungbacteria bacterium RIFCSPLOWO2_01_FULL_47_32]
MAHVAYKRVILKLSGETLGGKGQFGLDVQAAEYIGGEVKTAHDLGCEVAIVIGGGNFIRGEKLSKLGIDRETADYMGMLGTVINGLALQSVLEKKGLYTRVMTPIDMREVAEPFIRRRALRHLEKKRIVIFCGGTGSPYFSTDTAAALRASEIGADAILKATNVEGVYESDPKVNKKAKLFREITPMDVVKKHLKVMDLTAITLSMENSIPVVVFDVFKKGNLGKLLKGEKIGTRVRA